MKKSLALVISIVMIMVSSGCGGTVLPSAATPTPSPTPIPVDSVTLTFNTFDMDELVFDMPQYEEKDIIFEVTVEPAEYTSFLEVTSSNTEVAEIKKSDGDDYKLQLKSAGETMVTATCGEKTKTIDIVVTDLPKAEKALVMTMDTTVNDGTATSEVYTYDENNLCITKDLTETSEDGSVKEASYSYTYNDKGLCIAGKGTDGLSVKFEYDEQGNQTLYQITHSGQSDTIIRTEFDEYGNITRDVLYFNSSLISDTKYSYDENGTLSQENSAFLGIETEKVYTYNEDGQVINVTETLLLSDSVTTTDKFYDENGWLVREEVLGDYDYNPKVTEYEYDVYGKLMNETVTDPNDEEKSYSRVEYEYDEYGNCTEERTYKDESSSEPYSVTNRTWKIVTA